MYTYPHTIESGNGERITFLGRTRTSRGVRIDVENTVAPGAGPPMHVHHFEDETFIVVEGRIGYERAGEPAAFAGPGETVTFHAGEVHRFWNAGDGPLRCTGFIEPAGNIEYFLTSVYASLRASGGHRPGLFDAAFLLRRYRTEFAMTDIPAPVQRFVFPVVAALGHLLGKYGKYADAPAPRRSAARPSFTAAEPAL